MRTEIRLGLLVLLVGALCAGSALAKDRAPEPSGGWFTDVAKRAGLHEERGKDGMFVDLDGDGFLDVVLDSRHAFLSRDGGTRFEPHEHGIEFPEREVVPLDKDGKPNPEKAKTKPIYPGYLYFADVDNDGDQDALFGVRLKCEWVDERGFRRVPEADHGVRSTVWLNDGSGTFTKAAPKNDDYGSDETAGPAMALAIVDVDRDGNLDLFEGRDYRVYGRHYAGAGDLLFRGDGKGGFTDVTADAGLSLVPTPAQPNSARPSYGVTHADIDNDGDQDLLTMSYGRRWNRQWQNDGKGRFTDVAMETGFFGDDITHGRYPEFMRKRGRKDEAPFRSNGNTFDCAVADYDNDGDLDCFLGEITHGWAGEASDLSALLVNEDGKFRHVTVDELLPPRDRRDARNWNNGDLHVGWADFDNDTLQDLVIASGDYPDGQFLRVYRQKPDHTFEEVGEDLGVTWEGCGGLSLGDFDRDGDVDILVGRSFMRLNKAHREKFMDGMETNHVGLLRNDVANASGNRFLSVRLVGGAGRKDSEGKANRAAIGARIEVACGDVTMIREIRAGSGLSNHQDPPEAWFGLGKEKTVDRITVRWPDGKGTTQSVRDVPADRFVTIVQGLAKPIVSETFGGR